MAPRVVAVACLDAEAPPPEEEPEEPWTSFPELDQAPPAQVPVLLLVNHETRALALSRYEPSFAWKTPHVLLSSTLQQGSPTTPGATWSRPSVWFSHALDAVYLLGQLEPCDSYGFNSPLSYFLDREEARRVRRLVIAFAALKYGEMAPQHIFGALFHCVDRFAHALRDNGGRVLVAVTPRDEYTNALMGGQQPLVGDGGEAAVMYLNRDEVVEARRSLDGDEVNIVQKTWRDWYRGSIVKSSLANVQFELVRESDLPQHIAKLVENTGDES